MIEGMRDQRRQSAANVVPSITGRAVRFGAALLTVMVLTAIAANAEPFDTASLRTPGPRSTFAIEAEVRPGAEDIETEDPSEPIEIPQPVTIALAVAAGVGLLYLLARQQVRLRFRRPSIRLARGSGVDVAESDDAEQAEVIADFARDLIDELREGDSPRHAIQRAYAAVETGFGSPELARRPAETPLKYLSRIFGRHRAVSEPLGLLTDLFQRARFSDEPIDEPMRALAIDALGEIRDYYTTIAWSRIEKRERAAR